MDYAYGADGNLVSETEANDHITRYTYNSLDQRMQITYADDSTRQEQFDALGRRTQMTHQAGYAYDALAGR